MIWVSQAAREKWESAISRVSAAVSEMEIESVFQRQRLAAWQTIPRATLPDYAKRMAEKNLVVLPIQYVGSFQGFIHYTPAGDSNVYCVIARDIETANGFRKAFIAGDHDTQGHYLGFPKCCREFFAREWGAGNYDPIPMMDRTGFHPLSNPALRYIGVRVGFHIPCSFNCHRTVQSAIERLECGQYEDRKLLTAFLSMPMQWDALHGILQIRTPLFWLITTTVPTHRAKIDIPGSFIPAEGVWPGNL